MALITCLLEVPRLAASAGEHRSLCKHPTQASTVPSHCLVSQQHQTLQVSSSSYPKASWGGIPQYLAQREGASQPGHSMVPLFLHRKYNLLLFKLLTFHPYSLSLGGQLPLKTRLSPLPVTIQ